MPIHNSDLVYMQLIFFTFLFFNSTIGTRIIIVYIIYIISRVQYDYKLQCILIINDFY